MLTRRNSLAAFLIAIAGVWILAAVLSAGAQERVFNFTKDIQVMPTNENQKTNINVRLEIDKTRVNPGDTITIRFQTERDCYLKLVDQGTSGKITCLWPNQFSGSDNFVKAGRWYTFPSPTDNFQFQVSGPEGVEKIFAVATASKDLILRDEDFTGFKNGFKSYSKSLKDLVVTSTVRMDRLRNTSEWGTTQVSLVIGRGPSGGSITSKSVHVLSFGAATGKLNYCDTDAASFSQLIADRLRVPPENVRLVTGRQATRDEIIRAMEWLSSRTKPEDLVFLYFSGHGTQVPDTGVKDEADGLDEAFVCYHSKPNLTADDPDLNKILLIDDDFDRYMSQVPARRKIVVVDSCHSGSIHKALNLDLISKYEPIFAPGILKQLQVVSTGPGGQAGRGEMAKGKICLLSACADSEASFEDRSKQSGLFTYWLLKSLSSGGDLSSAFESTRRQVTEEIMRANLRQSPTITDEYGLTRDIRF